MGGDGERKSACCNWVGTLMGSTSGTVFKSLMALIFLQPNRQLRARLFSTRMPRRPSKTEPDVKDITSSISIQNHLLLQANSEALNPEFKLGLAHFSPSVAGSTLNYTF